MMILKAVGLLTALVASGAFGYYLYCTRNVPDAIQFTVGMAIGALVLMVGLWVAQQVTSHLTSAVINQVFLLPEGVCTVCVGALLVRRAARPAPPDTS